MIWYYSKCLTDLSLFCPINAQSICFDNFCTTGFSVHFGIIFVLVFLANSAVDMTDLGQDESGLGDIFNTDDVDDYFEQTEGNVWGQ